MRTRHLGITTALALVLLSAIGTSAASANWFRAEVAPEKWNGSRVGGAHALELGSAYAKFTCENVSFPGETGESTLVTSLTVNPTLADCKRLGGKTAGWVTNGCQFRFHSASGFTSAGSIDIVNCSSPMYQQPIGSPCRTEIGNQSGLGAVTYKNTTVNGMPAITIAAHLTGITYTRWYGNGICGEGDAGTFHNGTYDGEWTVVGATAPGGAQAGVHLGANIGGTPVFVTQESPVTVSGVNSEAGMQAMIAPLGGMGLYCESYSLSGAASTVAVETLALVPTYKKCQFGNPGSPVSDSQISSGGCNYAFHANGGFAIAGATCASNPITLTKENCVVTIGPQSGFSGFTYSNSGGGVSIKGSTGKKITYTITGSSCEKQGTFSSATLITNATLAATNSGGKSTPIWFE